MMTTLIFDPLEAPAGSATDRVFDVLYDAIIRSKLPPGARVSEQEIAKQLDVSRQPVRDAFFQLKNLGFLAIRPQRATLITPISVQAVKDAMFTRTALEVESLRAAMGHNLSGLIEVLTTNLAQQRTTKPQDAAGFHALDEAFHEAICTQSGHTHVWSLIRTQKAHLDRIRFLTLSQERHYQVIAEHEGILGAIAIGDAHLAEQRLRDHIGALTDILPDIIAEMPDYFDTDANDLRP
jgi:DNA-binding GntR family transcriptional regulator